MSNNLFGYCRVSTVAQNDARQIEAMKQIGVKETNIFREKASGKDFERPQYKRLMNRLEAGDLLVVSSIDRLGRNYDEIIMQWQFLVKKKRVDIVVLDMPLLDTRGDQDLTGQFISELVLQILSYVAQKEREAILVRRAEGVALAMARGVKFGRKPKEKPENFEMIREIYRLGLLTGTDAAKRVGVSYPTFKKWCTND